MADKLPTKDPSSKPCRIVFSKMDNLIYGRRLKQSPRLETDEAADLRPVHGIELAQNLPGT